MSDDLLAKEKEFRRLNKELDDKSRDLIKEINTVISGNRSATFNTDRPHSSNKSIDKIKPDLKESKEVKQSKCETVVQTDKTCKSDKGPCLIDKEKIIIGDIEEVTNKKSNAANKALVHFLKSKVDILQNELQVIQSEYRKKTDCYKELEAENKKLDNIKTKLQNHSDLLKETITKLENKNHNMHTEYQALTAENLALRKDKDDITKEMKTLNHQFHSYDVRLNKSLEDNEKLRMALKASQTEEKELRNQVKKLQESNRISLKNLEKQRTELLQAFKKQMLLVDNLKRQNAYLLLTKHIQLEEDAFMKLLEYKDQHVIN